jgi:hypothetical protein
MIKWLCQHGESWPEWAKVLEAFSFVIFLFLMAILFGMIMEENGRKQLGSAADWMRVKLSKLIPDTRFGNHPWPILILTAVVFFIVLLPILFLTIALAPIAWMIDRKTKKNDPGIWKERFSAYNRTIPVLLMMTSCLASGQGSYNFYLNGGESGNSGDQITTTILNASTYTNAFAGTWSIFPSPHTQFAVTNQNNAALRGSHYVGSSYYDGAGNSKTMVVKTGINNGVNDMCKFDIGSPFQCGQFSCGWFWSRGPVTVGMGDSVDTVYIHTTSGAGDFIVANHYSDGPSPNLPGFRVHTQLGVGPMIFTDSNKTYWCTMLCDTNIGANGIGKFALFDTNTWLMVGMSTLGLQQKGVVDYVKFGDLEGHTINEKFNMYFDNFLMVTGSVAAANWPLLPPGAKVIPNSTSRTDFDQAYTNAVAMVGTNRDTVAIPAGSANWSSQYTVAKDGLVVRGAGTNTTALTRTGAAADALLKLTGQFNVVSNMSILGSGTEFYTGIEFGSAGNWGKAGYLYMSGLSNCFLCANGGVAYKFVAGDSFRVARVINNTAYYDAHYPMAYDDTNTFCFEDGKGFISGAKAVTGSMVWISSQQGQAYQVRNCDWVVNNASCDMAPDFDFHGDDSASGIFRPGVSCLINSNRVTITSGQHNGKFADMRGSQSSISSNQVIWSGTDDGIHYREERPLDAPNYHVTGPSRYWENYRGASGTSAMVITDDDPTYIILGSDLTNAAPASFVMVQYPHPLRNEAAASGIPDLGYTPAAPRLRGIRISR